MPQLAFDVAILDVNLDGEQVFPVADSLAKHGLPFIFVAGYGESNLPPFRGRPALQKPSQSPGSHLSGLCAKRARSKKPPPVWS
jgi:hypothetical protein